MDKWKKYLQLLGLTEGETGVYLSVLKSGPRPVQEIAKDAGFSRVTVYAAIESLAKMGLMTSVEKGKKQVFAAEPPERIVSLAENKMNSIKNTIQEIKGNIDELKLVQSGDKPVVKMFEGVEAFGAIQEDVLKSKIDLMCEFGNLDEINNFYPYDKNVREKYYDKLAATKMRRKLIYLSTDKSPKRIEPNKEIKYLDDKSVKPFFGDIFFYDNTVWLSSFKGRQIAVMIKSKELKDTIQAAFDIIWEKL